MPFPLFPGRGASIGRGIEISYGNDKVSYMIEFMDAAGFFVTGVLAGLAGAGAMWLVLNVITRIPMVKAVGSLLTQREEGSLAAGSLVHLLSAVFFGMVYTLILLALPGISPWTMIGVGALIGFLHGVFTSLILVFAVAERHPVEKYREAGFSIGMAHLGGHVAFGVAVATVVALAGISQPPM